MLRVNVTKTDFFPFPWRVQLQNVVGQKSANFNCEHRHKAESRMFKNRW